MPASAATGVLDGRAAVLFLRKTPVSRPTRVLGSIVPLVPMVAGIGLSAWRFRAGDGLGGLAIGLAGMALMVLLAIRMTDSE